MNIYAADEFLAELLASDSTLQSLVNGAVYRHREGLVPQQHPHILIRRAPEMQAMRDVSRGVFTCTVVVSPSLIENDDRPPELIAGPIASAILEVLRKFEDDELPPDLLDPTITEVWGGQILIPDYSVSYGLSGDTVSTSVSSASPSVLELGTTIRVWAA